MTHSVPYLVYAIVFDAGQSNCQFFEGLSIRDNHFSLLKRHQLAAAFQERPDDFVMGRKRFYEEWQLLLIDTGSDLYTGRTGHQDPLTELATAAERWAAFTQCLRASNPGCRIMLLTGGLRSRVPGITTAKLKHILAGGNLDMPVIELTSNVK